jgi:hypothetical protein
VLIQRFNKTLNLKAWQLLVAWQGVRDFKLSINTVPILGSWHLVPTPNLACLMWPGIGMLFLTLIILLLDDRNYSTKAKTFHILCVHVS